MRNKNVEAIRGISLLVMVTYHYISQSGMSVTPLLSNIFEVCGRLSLMSFLIISGYGMFCYYNKHELNGDPVTLPAFLKRRLRSIAPPYLFVLFVLLLFGMNAGFLDKSKILNSLLETLFLTNLFPERNFANGATWTVALILQTYLFSGVMYKALRRKSTMIALLAGSVLLRSLLVLFMEKLQLPNIYFVAATIRYPVTTLDLFFMGMLIAKYPRRKDTHTWEYAAAAVLLVGSVVMVSKLGCGSGLGYDNSVLSFVVRYGGGILIAFLIWLYAGAKVGYESILGRSLQSIAKNEYHIYLIHMPLVANLLTFSPLIVGLKNQSPLLFVVVMLLIAVTVGTVFASVYKPQGIRKPLRN